MGLLFRSLFHCKGEGEEKGEAFIESCHEGAHLVHLEWRSPTFCYLEDHPIDLETWLSTMVRFRP